MLVSLTKSEKEKDSVALLLSEHFVLSNSQMPTSCCRLGGLALFFFFFVFIGKSLEDLFKQEVTEIKHRSRPLLSFSSPDPQNTCQCSRKGQLTNDTPVLNWGFDPRVTKGSHNATALRN